MLLSLSRFCIGTILNVRKKSISFSLEMSCAAPFLLYMCVHLCNLVPRWRHFIRTLVIPLSLSLFLTPVLLHGSFPYFPPVASLSFTRYPAVKFGVPRNFDRREKRLRQLPLVVPPILLHAMSANDVAPV